MKMQIKKTPESQGSITSSQKSTEKKRKVPVKVILVVIVIASVLCICSAILLLIVSIVRQVGSGNVISEERPAETFKEIRLEGAKLNLFIQQGTTQNLTVEAEDNVIDRISTKVKGDTLTVSYKKDFPFGLIDVAFLHKDVNVYVTLKDLDAVYLDGSGKVQTEGQLVLDSFKLEINGSADIVMDVKSFELETAVVGSGNVTYKGSVNTQQLEVSGSCDYLAQDLESEFTRIEVSGTADVEVNTSLKLDVKISGSGQVRYRGDPKVTQEISGTGSVEEI